MTHKTRLRIISASLAALYCVIPYLSYAIQTNFEVNVNRIEKYYQDISKNSTDPNQPKIFVQKIQDKDYRIFNPMSATPTKLFLADLSMPDKFSKTNNLAKKPGSFFRAFGEVVFLQGTLTDSFGVPISGARVNIWQKNAAGKYHSLLDPKSEYIDKNFNMSGTSITDNLGNYNFITILPGGSPGRSPHININVNHTKFGKLQTEIYFKNHPLNETDFQYMSYTPEERKSLTATVEHTEILNTKSIKICTFDVVMTGVNQYKRF